MKFYRRFLITSLGLALISPVHAADNVIRVINDDGSVSEIEISPEATTQPAPAPTPALAPEPEVQKSEPVKPVPPKPVAAPKKPSVKKASKKIAPAEDLNAPPPVASPDTKVKMVIPKKAEVKAPTPPKKSIAKKAGIRAPDRDPRDSKGRLDPDEMKKRYITPDNVKPEAAAPVPPVEAETIPSDELPKKRARKEGELIPREEAIATAVDSTSMIASRLDAYTRAVEGRDVWVIVFHTDEGERDILVDAKTGELVNAGPAPAPEKPAVKKKSKKREKK